MADSWLPPLLDHLLNRGGYMILGYLVVPIFLLLLLGAPFITMAWLLIWHDSVKIP